MLLVRSTIGAAGAAADRSIVVGLTLGLILACLYWPTWPLTPQFGLDEGWRAGLAWAHSTGLQWGQNLVFTHGPLSMLSYPLADNRIQVAAASIAWIATAVVIVGAIHSLARHGAWGSGLKPLLLAGAMSPFLMQLGPMLVQVGIVLAALIMVSSGTAVLVASGVLCGVLGNHKLIDAVLVFSLTASWVAAARGPRGVALLTTVTGMTYVAGWLLSGQAITNLPAHVMNALDLVRGYSTAMAYEERALRWQYAAAFGVTAAVLWYASRSWPNRPTSRALYLLGVGAALWFAFKEGFVRHDVWHAWYFFATAAGITGILAITRLSRSASQTGMALALCFVVVAATSLPTVRVLDREPSLAALRSSLRVVVDGQAGEELTRSAVGELSELYEITDDLREAIGSRPTAVDPWDVSALAATRAKWAPLPSMQLLSAYTAHIDRLNADALSQRPRQILRSHPNRAIDGRNPYWESPQYQLLIYCTYSVSFQTESWLLLRPDAVSRCGPPSDAFSVQVQAGQSVTVPRRKGAVTAVTISPSRSPLDFLVGLLYKPRPVDVEYGSDRWHLAHDPEAVRLLLNAPVGHAAFPLPNVPLDTLAVTEPATLRFEFIPLSERPG